MFWVPLGPNGSGQVLGETPFVALVPRGLRWTNAGRRKWAWYQPGIRCRCVNCHCLQQKHGDELMVMNLYTDMVVLEDVTTCYNPKFGIL